jgi:hypothetical protein
MSKDQDWRLRLDLEEPVDLDGLLRRVRDPSAEFEEDARSALSDDVVLTHDGSTFFAYTASERSLDDARDAIKSVLRHEQRKARIRLRSSLKMKGCGTPPRWLGGFQATPRACRLLDDRFAIHRSASRLPLLCDTA